MMGPSIGTGMGNLRQLCERGLGQDFAIDCDFIEIASKMEVISARPLP